MNLYSNCVNMKIIVFLMLIGLKCATLKRTTDVTLNIQERINLLKMKISSEIRQKQKGLATPKADNNDFVREDYEYVDIESKKITPIMDYDNRKKKDKFKLREIKTTAAIDPPAPDNVMLEDKSDKEKKGLRNHKKTESNVMEPQDIFYRRQHYQYLKDEPIQWLHCQDLVTPVITGSKLNVSVPKTLSVKDYKVRRLIELITLNTTGHTKEDIYSILYQISNLQIRLFQWEVGSIKLLFNAILLPVDPKDTKRGSFRGLKAGIKALFEKWHLDLHNTTNLLRQSKIFRPPCIQGKNHGGSTKTSRLSRYTKRTKTKAPCTKNDDRDECRRNLRT